MMSLGNSFVVSHASPGKDEIMSSCVLSDPLKTISCHTSSCDDEGASDIDDPFLEEEKKRAAEDHLKFIDGSLSYKELLSHPLKEYVFEKAVRRSLVEGNFEFFEKLKDLNIRLDRENGGKTNYIEKGVLWPISSIADHEFTLKFIRTLECYLEIGGSYCDQAGKSIIFDLVCRRIPDQELLCFLHFFKERGDRLDQTDENKQNLLHCVCVRTELTQEMLEFFKNLGTDMNAVDGKGFTALHYVIQNRYLEIEKKRKIIASLIKYGASAAKEAGFQSSAFLLSQSISNRSCRGLKKEISENSLIFNDLKLHSPKISWAETCQKGIPLWLHVITNGVSTNILQMIEELPSYSLSTRKGEMFLQLLIKNFQAPTDELFLLQCCAIIFSKPGKFVFLDKLDVSENTPLDYAIRYGLNELAKLLIRKGTTLKGNPYLDAAVQWDNLEIVKELLAQGADANEPDRSGNTPLHLSILHHRIEIAKIMRNPNWTIRNRDKFTVIDLMVKRGQITMYRALFNCSPKDLFEIFCKPLIKNNNLTPMLMQLNQFFIYSDFNDLRDLFLEILDQCEARVPKLREELVTTLKGFCTWGCLIARTGNITEENGIKKLHHSSDDNYVMKQVNFGKKCWEIVQAAKGKMHEKFRSFGEILNFLATERYKLLPNNTQDSHRFLLNRHQAKDNRALTTTFAGSYASHIPFIKSMFKRMEEQPIKNIRKISDELDFVSTDNQKDTFKNFPLGYEITFVSPECGNLIKLSTIAFVQEIVDGIITEDSVWKMLHPHSKESLGALDKLMEERHSKIFTTGWDFSRREHLQEFHSLLDETYSLLSHYAPLSRGSAQCGLMWRLLVLSFFDLPSVPLKLEIGMSDVRAIIQTVEDFKSESKEGLIYDYANLTPEPGWNLDRYCRELLEK